MGSLLRRGVLTLSAGVLAAGCAADGGSVVTSTSRSSSSSDGGSDGGVDGGFVGRSDAGSTTRRDAPATSAPTDVPLPTGCSTTPAVSTHAVPAFPGAEGFGAVATGGRGGLVCVVTTLAADGPGSFQDCAQRAEPRTIVFRVSGVIEGPVNLIHGNVTIAGQTSPGGVVVHGGLYCDNVYDPNDCRNVILRHMRFRNSGDDDVRIGGSDRVILDHLSFGGAHDESLECSRSQNVTVQYSIIAEPAGEHWHYGGLLLNYSKDRFPLANISIHHNVWNGVAGRLPEISCEENPDGPGTSNCAGRRLVLDVTNNVMFDALDPVYYNRCTGTNAGNDCAPSAQDFVLDLNFVGNVMFRRTSLGAGPMFAPDVARSTSNHVFWSDDLFYLGAGGTAAALALPSVAARMPTPSVTVSPAAGLVAALQRTAGALPHDPMDTRLSGYLSGSVDARPPAWSGNAGIDRGDALHLSFTTPPAPPADTDNDGMPDVWERAHGLDPSCPGAGLGTLAARSNNGVPGCAQGYSDLECYLNELAAQRAAGM